MIWLVFETKVSHVTHLKTCWLPSGVHNLRQQGQFHTLGLGWVRQCVRHHLIQQTIETSKETHLRGFNRDIFLGWMWTNLISLSQFDFLWGRHWFSFLCVLRFSFFLYRAFGMRILFMIPSGVFQRRCCVFSCYITLLGCQFAMPILFCGPWWGEMRLWCSGVFIVFR